MIRTPFRRSTLTAFALVMLASLLTGCDTPDMLRVKAYDQYRAGDYESSRATFERTIDKEPGDWKSHYYVGLVGLQQNDSAYARRHLEQSYTIRKSRPNNILSVDPDSVQETVPRPTQSQIADALAEAIYRQDSPAQLAGFLREMTTDRGFVEDYIRLGKYMHKIRDDDAAREGYLMAIKLSRSGDPTAYIAMADFYDEINDDKAAMNYLRQAYAVKPNDYEVVKRIRAHNEVPGPTIALPPQ